MSQSPIFLGGYSALYRRGRGRRRTGGDRNDNQQANSGGPMGAIFNVFPLILAPVLIYNIMAFAGGIGGSTGVEFRAALEAVWFTVPMASREDTLASAGQVVQWSVSSGDVLVLLALLLLFIELLKSTSTGTAAIFNHALSMLVFIICLVEFLLHPAFATTTFFLILVMSLLDVLAGVVVTIVSARRDVEFGSN